LTSQTDIGARFPVEIAAIPASAFRKGSPYSTRTATSARSKAAKIIGGSTCEYARRSKAATGAAGGGGRDEFLELLRAKRPPRYEFATLTDFLVHPFPKAEPLLGEPGCVLLGRGLLLMVYWADGSAKSTWTIDGLAHLAAGTKWLEIPVPRPVRICVIENEGPPKPVPGEARCEDRDLGRRPVRAQPVRLSGAWGEFTFAEAEAREALVAFCEEHPIDLVTANPTLGLGVAASGRPDEPIADKQWPHFARRSGAVAGSVNPSPPLVTAPVVPPSQGAT
jgi:hypothetical protein